nr:hypothetical protein [Marinicella sp. W31]MDC2879129.1 hypothetical protein [Marinicella sp. W31]
MIADDQFALAPAKRKQRVHGNDAGLHRFGHQVALNDRGGRAFDRQTGRNLDRPLAIKRAAQRIDDPAQQRFTDRNLHDLARAEYRVTSLDIGCGIQKHAADQVGAQHPGEPDLAAFKAQHLVQLHIAQPGDHRHAVADFLDLTSVFDPWPERGTPQRALCVGKPVGGVSGWHRSSP